MRFFSRRDKLSENSDEIGVLREFLSFDLYDSMPVLKRFETLDGAAAVFDKDKFNFVYVPGKRKDRVLLVAHADTVWDSYYDSYGSFYSSHSSENGAGRDGKKHAPVLADSVFRQGAGNGVGLGADDRAGCAMLWLLKDSGHSLLVTDGEEHGQIGANHLMVRYPEIAGEINSHCYMIQLDRRNGSDYKTYGLPVTEEFRAYIEAATGYSDAGARSCTDIVSLCEKICGVNLSVGYYREHTPEEYLDVSQWLGTYLKVKELLKNEQPRFPLAGI